MEIFEFEQRTPEWYAIRKGVITASGIASVLSKSSPRETYLYEKAAEILSSSESENFTNSFMQWGIDTEPQAKAYYELDTGLDVKEVGFVKAGKYIGCSPDGLIGDDGMIEIKCPKTSTHIKYLAKNKLPATYRAQVQAQMWVCERDWCDFVSFDPRVGKYEKKIFKIRVERDDEYIEKLDVACTSFIEELKQIVGDIDKDSI